MQTTAEKIQKLIYSAIEEINAQQPDESKMKPSLDSVLIGDNGAYDSLAIVNLIANIEEKIELNADQTVSLFQSQFNTGPNNPFQTVGSLMSFVLEKLTLEH